MTLLEDAQTAGQIADVKDGAVNDGADHMTSCRGNLKKKLCLVLLMLLLQITGVSTEKCLLLYDVASYWSYGSGLMFTFNLATHHYVDCPHGCCGIWKDQCCKEPPTHIAREPDEEPPADEQSTPKPCHCKESSDDGHKAAEKKSADGIVFSMFVIGVLLFLLIVV
ncbi:uncharacterized protein LOC131942362 isoform X2 [Physella acuta]|nr:uncharacterized protein LOC131942362 isoform X2 [Physella acuta]